MGKKPSDAVDQQQNGKQWSPTYQTTSEFDSHLFELKTMKMLKNVSWSAQNPEIHEVDHQHFFHTFDSGGKEQIHSTSTGGHFHVVTIEKDPKTGAPVAKCSGPKMYQHRKGKKILVDLPRYAPDANNVERQDNHTHEVVYLRSSRVKPRTVSAEAVKVIDQLETSKETMPDGIRSGQ